MSNSTITTLEETARAVACDIADQFEHSWNAVDGAAYAEPFAEDADFITIQGHQVVGRDAIGAGMSEILATIYHGSTVAVQVTGVRVVSSTTIVAQVEHVLDAPTGPLAGNHTTLATVVVVESEKGWEITTLHNTLILDPAPGS